MTTIVAVQNKNHVIMGSDSQVTSGHMKQAMFSGKIVANGPYTFGLAGNYFTWDALTDMLWPVPPTRGQDLRKFVRSQLAPFLDETDKEASGGSSMSSILLAVYGEVFLVESGVVSPKVHLGRYAIGSGSLFALGALNGIGRGRATIRDVRRALESAASSDIGTSGPFVVKKVV